MVAAGQAIVRPSASNLVDGRAARLAAGDVLWRTDGRVGRRLPRPARREGERACLPIAECVSEQDENSSSATPRLAWSGADKGPPPCRSVSAGRRSCVLRPRGSIRRVGGSTK